jgi:hypothetical protein
VAFQQLLVEPKIPVFTAFGMVIVIGNLWEMNVSKFFFALSKRVVSKAEEGLCAKCVIILCGGFVGV